MPSGLSLEGLHRQTEKKKNINLKKTYMSVTLFLKNKPFFKAVLKNPKTVPYKGDQCQVQHTGRELNMSPPTGQMWQLQHAQTNSTGTDMNQKRGEIASGDTGD